MQGRPPDRFYARFGDMRGFLDAMHERVLAMLVDELAPVFVKASQEPDLETALRTLCTAGFEVVNRHRAQTYFFAVGNSQDPAWRAMGSQFTLGINDAVTQIMKSHLPKSSSAVAKLRIDMAVRMIIASVFQQVMLDQAEISRLNLSQKVVATELAAMVSSYLRATPAT